MCSACYIVDLLGVFGAGTLERVCAGQCPANLQQLLGGGFCPSAPYLGVVARALFCHCLHGLHWRWVDIGGYRVLLCALSNAASWEFMMGSLVGAHSVSVMPTITDNLAR